MDTIFGASVVVLYVLTCVPSFADARYCKIEADGQISYYVCPRNEYCCSKGCCISPTFQFYQLWYYWLMVIFMLVVCSGGQWWYRYWINGGRYLIPPPHVSVSSSTTRQMHHRSPLTTETSTRVLYHPSPHGHGSTVVFWKPPYPRRPMAEPPPSYATVIPPSPKFTYGQQIPSGPPPSYESVIGLSNTGVEDRADQQNSSSAETVQQHIEPGEPSSASSQVSRNDDIPAISPTIPQSSGSPTTTCDPHQIT